MLKIDVSVALKPNLRKNLVNVLVGILIVSLMSIVFVSTQAGKFPLPSTLWSDDFRAGSSSVADWTVYKGGQGVVENSSSAYYSAPYSLHLKSPSNSYAYAYPPKNRLTEPESNGSLCSIDYTKNYMVDLYFYLPSSDNHWIYVFTNRHINSVIDYGTTFTTRSGLVNTPVIALNTSTWYRIQYWVNVTSQTYQIDIYNVVTATWVVQNVTRNFHGSSTWIQDPFMIGDADVSSPGSNWGEAYWDDIRIWFTASYYGIPVQNVVFRLLAVEQFFSREGVDYPMKSAQYLIQNLTRFINWQNVTWGGFNYFSYIHLLSYTQLEEGLSRFYRGESNRSNVVNEITNFLGQPLLPGEDNALSVRIFYYNGHSSYYYNAGEGFYRNVFYMQLGRGPSYENLYDFELNQTLLSGTLLNNNCTLIILDTCYSGGYKGQLCRPGRVIMASQEWRKKTPGWVAGTLHPPQFWGWFTGHQNTTCVAGCISGSSGWTGPVGIIGGLFNAEDDNHDGWRSAWEIYRFAAPTARQYAENHSSTMDPQWQSGVSGGAIPVVMHSLWRGKYIQQNQTIVLSQNMFSYNGPPIRRKLQPPQDKWDHFHNTVLRTGCTPSCSTLTSDLTWLQPFANPVVSSAALVDGLMFIGTLGGGAGGGAIYALNMISGEVVWSFLADGPISLSPAVKDGLVIFGTETPGKLYALDEYTGVVRWVYELPPGFGFISSPAVVDDMVFVGSTDGYVYAFNQSTGMPIWNFSTGGPVISSPAVANGRVFVGSYNGRLYVLYETTGLLSWDFQTGGPIKSTPSVSGGKVFIGSADKKVYALNEMTGGPPIWVFQTNGPVISSPAVDSAKKLVVVGSQDGRVYAIHQVTGLSQWNFSTQGPIDMSSPAISSNGLVYIGSTDKNVYCLNETTGLKIWNHTTGDQVVSSPSISEEHVFIGSKDGTIYCFGPPFPVHDVAVLNVTVSPTVVSAGRLVNITYTVKNKGNVVETFNVTLAYNTTRVWTAPEYLDPTEIHTETIALNPDSNVTVTYVWNTTGLIKGNYTISAQAWAVQGETDTADDMFMDGRVLVTIPGDVNGDCVCDMKDIVAMILTFGTKVGDPNYKPNYDVNCDGRIDMKDIVTAILHFGQKW